jgi:hypothetical protein
VKIIVFLDIDGILAWQKTYNLCVMSHSHTNQTPTENHIALFDKDCIKVLNFLTDSINSTIVVSSTWGNFYKYKVLVDFLKLPIGIKADILRTTARKSLYKEEEIRLWLNWYEDVKDCIVIDDDPLDTIEMFRTYYGKWHFLRIEDGFHKGGLRMEEVKKFLYNIENESS